MGFLEKSRWGCLAAAVFVGLVWILFPVVNCGPESTDKTAAKNDVLQLVNAIKGFYTEYGRLPQLSGEAVPVNYQLLSILMGNNLRQNPRKIVFLEVPTARKKSGRWENGIEPETGDWLDPYGNPYWIKLDVDANGKIYNPYTANAGSAELSTQVIVWSPGKDGILGNPKMPRDFRGSDDIISWQ